MIVLQSTAIVPSSSYIPSTRELNIQHVLLQALCFLNPLEHRHSPKTATRKGPHDICRSELSFHSGEQLGNLPPLCKNIAGGWTQNAISIIFAKYRLVSEVLGIWFLRRAISNFVHNFLLISIKDWYSCQLLIFWSDDIVCWSKFPNFDMWVGCQKLSAILNLRLIEYSKI